MASIAAAFLTAAPLDADEGVRISVGEISINDALATGGTYHLPDLVISNPGSESARYRMAVGTVSGQSKISVEPSWIAFSPTDFSLDPGASQPVSVQLTIPADGPPGSYLGYLKAQLIPGATAVAIGPAAAAKLTFDVTSSDGVTSAIRGLLTASAPWLVIMVTLAASLFALRIIRRRWSFRVERRE